MRKLDRVIYFFPEHHKNDKRRYPQEQKYVVSGNSTRFYRVCNQDGHCISVRGTSLGDFYAVIPWSRHV